MLISENDNSSFCEEPKIYYYSTSSNYGVKAVFSDRNNKSIKKYNLSLTPTSSNNNRFSLCNTIMLPTITTEIFTESEKNDFYNDNICKINKKDSSPNEKANSSLYKDNTRIKTFYSKDEKNCSDLNQLSKLLIDTKICNDDNLTENTTNLKEKTNYEKNPYFLGKHFANNYQNILKNNNLKKINTSEDEKNENESHDFFKRGPSRSLFERSKNDEREDKCYNNVKTRKKLSMGNHFSNLKMENKKEKTRNKKEKVKEKEKEKSRKKKINFMLKIKKENDNNSEKEENFKIKKEKEKRNSLSKFIKKKTKNYESYKYLANNYDISSTPKNKKNNDNNKSNFFEGIKKAKKIKKNIKFNRLKTQKIEYNINDPNIIQNIKEESKENIRKRISNKYNSVQPDKKLNKIKEGIKIKDKDDDNSKEHNSNSDKKSDEIKNYVIRKVSGKESRKKDKIKELFKKGLSSEAKIKPIKEKIRRYSNNKLILTDNNNNNSEENNQINKCLTIDLNKKKNIAIFDKNLNAKNALISFRKKIENMAGFNLFGKDDNNKNNHKNIDFEKAVKHNSKKTQFNLFSKDKFTNTEFNRCDYLKYTLDCMDLILDIDMEKQTRLKNKINFNFPKPKKNKIKKKIALFDLDETLVHCTGDIKLQKEKYQHAIDIQLPGKQAVKVGINLRPFWKQTLNLIKKNYYIVIYTASHQAYADAVLDFMDPKKKYFKYRLYRNNCSLIDVDGAKFYVKDLDILNEYYDLKDIVIIDNSVLSFAFHLHNGIPIVPYYDEDIDGSLYVVGLYLMHIFNENDLREANKKQINLDSFIEEAKKEKEKEELGDIDIDQIEEASDSKEEENYNANNVTNNNDLNKEKSVLEKKHSIKSVEEKIKKMELEKYKFSGKKNNFSEIKKSSKFILPFEHRDRDKNNDIDQKKLMSQSKLFNMYYDLKDKSFNNENIIEEQIKEDNNEYENKENKENKDKGNDSFSLDKEDNNKPNIIFYDNDDCKSDPGHFHAEHHYISDSEHNFDDKEFILKRVFTIIEDISLSHKTKDPEDEHRKHKSHKINSKINLGFIRSSFYNNFKI